MNYGIAFTPLVPSLVIWLAVAAIAVIAVLLLLGRARGAAVRVAALASCWRSPIPPSRARIVSRCRRWPWWSPTRPSQSFGSRTARPLTPSEALVDSLKKIKGLEVRVVDAGQADGETDGTKLFGALSSALSDVPVDPRRRRLPDHRRSGARHCSTQRIGARIPGSRARPDYRAQGRARPTHRDISGSPFRHCRTKPDHHLPAGRSGCQRRPRQDRGAPRR